MKNVIILGSGRSGTSMVAGTLAKTGYFMGEELWPTRESNPKGFFEDREINEINEDILEPYVPKRLSFFGFHILKNRPNKWQRWLSVVPVETDIKASEKIQKRIEDVTGNEPFCFKDPRFCYTLPVWMPYLKNTVFICVFRDPGTTAASIVKETHTLNKDADNSNKIIVDPKRALKIWTIMYKHILFKHFKNGEWLFLHYNQVLQTSGLDKIEAITLANVDTSFPEKSLNRTRPSIIDIPAESKDIYQKLCELAEYKE